MMKFRTVPPCLVLVLACFISSSFAQWDYEGDYYEYTDYGNGRQRRQAERPPGPYRHPVTGRLYTHTKDGSVQLLNEYYTEEPAQPQVVTQPSVSTVQNKSEVTTPSVVTSVVTSYVEKTVTSTLRLGTETAKLTNATAFTATPVIPISRLSEIKTALLPEDTIATVYDYEKPVKIQNSRLPVTVTYIRNPPRVSHVNVGGQNLPINDVQFSDGKNTKKIDQSSSLSGPDVEFWPSPGSIRYAPQQPVAVQYNLRRPEAYPRYVYNPSKEYLQQLAAQGYKPSGGIDVPASQSPRVAREAEIRRLLVDQYEEDLYEYFDFGELE